MNGEHTQDEYDRHVGRFKLDVAGVLHGEGSGGRRGAPRPRAVPPAAVAATALQLFIVLFWTTMQQYNI
jgi:hypothetical protein